MLNAGGGHFDSLMDTLFYREASFSQKKNSVLNVGYCAAVKRFNSPSLPKRQRPSNRDGNVR